MQNDYRTSILSYIERYRSLTPVAIIQERFPDQPDLTAVTLGPYTAATFLSLGNHAIDSIEAAMKASTWHTLPASIQGHNEFGQVDVNSALTSYVDLLSQKSLDQATQHLSRLVWYCMACGIWIDEKKVKLPTRTEVKLLADELSLSAKRLGGQLESIEKASSELVERRQDLANFTEEKKNELGDIRRGLEEARQHLNTLQAIVEQATIRNNEVSVIKDEGQNVLNELNVQLGVITKGYDGFKGDSEKLKSDLAKTLDEAKEQLSKSDEQFNTILSYRLTIEKYLGYSVDGYLGNKFDDRAEKLRKGLRFWQWAVPISVVVSIAWVGIVFTCLRTDLGNEWVNLGVNLLKTTPAFILMGFTFGQYGKERNLQEEYAFKSAVAMTINAYANLLADKDADANKSRQQLILRALEEVHKQPKLYSDKGGTLISLKAREIRDTMHTLNETLQNLKGNS